MGLCWSQGQGEFALYVFWTAFLLMNKPFICFLLWLMALSSGLSWDVSLVLVPVTKVRGRMGLGHWSLISPFCARPQKHPHYSCPCWEPGHFLRHGMDNAFCPEPPSWPPNRPSAHIPSIALVSSACPWSWGGLCRSAHACAAPYSLRGIRLWPPGGPSHWVLQL